METYLSKSLTELRVMHDTNTVHSLLIRLRFQILTPFIPSDTIHPKSLLLFKQRMLFFKWVVMMTLWSESLYLGYAENISVSVFIWYLRTQKVINRIEKVLNWFIQCVLAYIPLEWENMVCYNFKNWNNFTNYIFC